MVNAKTPVTVWHVATGPFDPLTFDIDKVRRIGQSFRLEPRSLLAAGLKGQALDPLDRQAWFGSYEQGVPVTLLVEGSGLFQVANLSAQSGFIYLRALRQKDRPSYDFTRAFIIMSMTAGNRELDDIRDNIEQGVALAAHALGMPPVRCFRVDDRRGATYKIDEEIFTNIERSGLIICDLTEEKPNCYFELAWALAHQRKVIVTAKRGTKIHFDVSRFSIIFWENLRELRERVRENAIAVYTEQRMGGRP